MRGVDTGGVLHFAHRFISINNIIIIINSSIITVTIIITTTKGAKI